MAEYLYHGSPAAGIERLRAGSKLHGSGEPVLYLTDNPAYAMLYIWDFERAPCKHVTAWISGGRARYEEQFSGQLEAFYGGVEGWLYRVERTPDMVSVEGREGLFAALGDQPAAGGGFIPDVYRGLLERERLGDLKVLRFTERTPAEQAELTGRIASFIGANGFFGGREEAGFYRRYFREAWEMAGGLTNGAKEGIM